MQIDFQVGPCIPTEQAERNAIHARGLGLETIKPGSRSGRLAVVGGAPSVQAYVETLRRWNGDIWAINGAWRWCRDNGIAATFFSVDPDPKIATLIEGADHAIVMPQADPLVFEKMQGKRVELFDATPPGCSSSTNAPFAAMEMGYTEITFFGCDCSYSPEKSHAYYHEPNEMGMVVEVGGNSYLTDPAYWVQVEELAALIREFPKQFKELSGGLLRALVQDSFYDVTWVSPLVEQTYFITPTFTVSFGDQ
jgi:hypothetical protein